MEMINDKSIQPSKENNKEFGLIVHNGGKNKEKYPSRKKFYSITKTEFDHEENSTSVLGKFKVRHSEIIDSSDTFDIIGDTYLRMDTGRKKSEPPINGGGGGGGNDMEKRLDMLERKTEQIQVNLSDAVRSLAVIEEIQKSAATKSDILELKNELINAIHQFPKEDNIKQIIATTNKDQKLTNENFVESKITTLANTQIKWMIGTAVAIIGAIFTILRFFN